MRNEKNIPAFPWRLAVLAFQLLFILSTSAQAAESHPDQVTLRHAAGPHVEHLTFSHPTIPGPHIVWPGLVLIGIAAMFFLAAFLGPIIRAEMPQEVPPPAHSHDEPPGTSGHHGHGGTVQHPEPEEEH